MILLALIVVAWLVMTAAGYHHEPPLPRPPRRPPGWCLADAIARRYGPPEVEATPDAGPWWVWTAPVPLTPPDVPIPVADQLDLTARCRWASPTYSTTTQMEAIAP